MNDSVIKINEKLIKQSHEIPKKFLSIDYWEKHRPSRKSFRSRDKSSLYFNDNNETTKAIILEKAKASSPRKDIEISSVIASSDLTFDMSRTSKRVFRQSPSNHLVSEDKKAFDASSSSSPSDRLALRRPITPASVMKSILDHDSKDSVQKNRVRCSPGGPTTIFFG